MVTLRPYQIEILESIKTGYESGNLNQLLTACTASGKTLTFCSVRDFLSLGGPVLVLAHLDTLLTQAMTAWAALHPSDILGLEQGENHLDPETDYDVIFASVATLRGKRLEAMLRRDFTFVVADEAHHTQSDSWLRIIEAMDLLPERRRAKTLLLGVTATPDRTDRKSLQGTFPYHSYDYSLWRAMEEGYWTPVEACRVFTGTDLTDITFRNGEYVEAELDEALIQKKRTGILYENWIAEKGQQGRTVIFCSSRKHARHIQEYWQAKNHPSFYLDGESKDREAVIKAFRTSTGGILANVRLVSEGVDIPEITHAIFASPMYSLVQLIQSLGRIVRLNPGKERAVVLYTVDKTGGKAVLKTPPSLLGLPSSFDLEGQELTESRALLHKLVTDSPVSVGALLESGRIPDTFEEFKKALDKLGLVCPKDLLGGLKDQTNLSWVVDDTEALLSGQVEDAESYVLSIPAPLSPVGEEPRERRLIRLDWSGSAWRSQVWSPPQSKARMESRMRMLRASLKEETNPWKKRTGYLEIKGLRDKIALIMDECISEAKLSKTLAESVAKLDRAVLKNMPSSLRIISLDAPWRQGEPSDGQLRFAKKLGIPKVEGWTKGQVTMMIDNALRRKEET